MLPFSNLIRIILTTGRQEFVNLPPGWGCRKTSNVLLFSFQFNFVNKHKGFNFDNAQVFLHEDCILSANFLLLKDQWSIFLYSHVQ